MSDDLFGQVELPEWTRSIMLAPEVQRLRQIRLINTSSPYIPALSDARRFTHTMGVAYLTQTAIQRLRGDFAEPDLRALMAAAICHDVGSPPFGHLFEYLLKSQTGWTHEAALAAVLAGTYRPDNIYHQIYSHRPLSLPKRFDQAGIDPGLVARMVVGETPLGGLIAGSLDLDNIDNVFRMSQLLGLRPDTASALELADSLVMTKAGIGVADSGSEALTYWRSLRRAAYEILAFDVHALSGQAMLTDAISCAMDEGWLGEEHWFWTDEELLRRLCLPKNAEAIRLPAQRFGVADFYECLGIFWYDQPIDPINDLRVPSRRFALAESLSGQVGFQCSVYVFYDQGTFEKGALTATQGRLGQYEHRRVAKSQSTIVGVFTPRRTQATGKTREAILEVLEFYGLERLVLRPPPRERLTRGTSEARLPL